MGETKSAASGSDAMDKEEVIICPEARERLRNIISGLPVDTRWRAPFPFHLYQGFWSPPDFLESIILAQEHFHPKPDDIFVCTATKSGTAWIKALTFAIVTRTRFDSSTSPLLSCFPHDCSPSLHRGFGKKPCFREPGMPLIHTHIPYPSLPESPIGGLRTMNRFLWRMLLSCIVAGNLGSDHFGTRSWDIGKLIWKIQRRCCS